MPDVGDMVSGKDIGRPNGGRYTWLACMDCGVERWVAYRTLGAQVARCFKCNKKSYPARLI